MSDRVHVVLFVADQFHAGWMGCAAAPWGYGAITPNLDRLAAEGVRFTNAYTQNPICTPARVSMLSGQYCHNHGYYGISGPSAPAPPSLFHHFKAHGYRTGGFGKLHLPDNPRNWVVDQCDEWSDIHRPATAADGKPDYQHYLDSVGLGGQDDSRGLGDVRVWGDHDSRPSRLPFEHCVDHWIAQRTCQFIDHTPDDRAMFMEVSFPRPHHAITPDRRFWDLYPDDIELPPTLQQDPSHRPENFQKMWRYLRDEHGWGYEPKDLVSGSRRVWRGTLAACSQVDHCVGIVVEHLRQRGMLDQTIIIFTADHGAYHGIHGIPEKAPGICSDAVCRVPMIWRTPAGCPGQVRQQLVEHVDMAATLPSMCGLPGMETVDGHDITSVLNDDAATSRQIAVTELPWSKAVRWGRWRFVHYHRAMYDGRDVGELYDIEADPHEVRNLYHDPEHAGTVNELRRLLLEWLTQTQRLVTMWPPLPPEKEGLARTADWPLAGDDAMPRSASPETRLRKGRLGVFNVADYL